MTGDDDKGGFAQLSIPLLEPARWPRRARAALVAVAAIGLFVHAQSINAVCDDAFISLRHAQNLAQHGAPVYNLGERVEGYTSPLWMLLSAGIVSLGMRGRLALQVLGDLGAIALIVSVWHLWNRIRPHKPLHGLVVLGLVAGSTPIAAWASSGLETLMFGALVALAIAEVARCTDEPSRRHSIIAGLCLALAVLTRPEGALVGIALFGWLVARSRTRAFALTFAAAALVPLIAFELWRYHYYGALLPNVYAAKVSAGFRERIVKGLSYTWFTITELGLGVSVLLVTGLAYPSQASVTRIIRVVVVPFVLYVIYVGGDFLDLFRFFVPILPLLYVTFVSSAMEVVARLKVPTRTWLLVGALAAVGFILGQRVLRKRALSVDEPIRRAEWIEPMGWTRRYGYVWADVGRFLKAHSRQGDSMAAPAAGAAPYYAGLPNIDLFGLADAEVARHGHYNGPRPGHQRFARLDYVLGRHPTFIMLDECVIPAHWGSWNWIDDGYECVIVSAPTRTGRAMRLTFLLDRTRAEELGKQRIAYRLKRPQ